MEGARLSLDVLVLHGVRSRLHNAVRVVRSVPVDIEDVAFSGLCASLAVLTDEQKQDGVLVLDLGGGTTDYVAYAGGVVAAAGVLAVGGDHVSNDIALAFNIPTARAETLKRQWGAAIVEPGSASRRVSLPAEVGFAGRSISLNGLQTVINARMDETLRLVRKRLHEAGVLLRIGAGVVLSGGGAQLKGLPALAEHVFGLPCGIGVPRDVSGLAKVTEGPQYAVAAGLVQYGFRTAASRQNDGRIGGLLRRFFGR
jgi:cell division protein FtsA